MFHRHTIPLLLCVSALACGGNATPGNPSPAADPSAARAASSATVVSSEEIAANGGATAYEVVDKLHRRWFRDQLSGKEVTIYSDNSPVDGGPSALRNFSARDVSSLEYYDGQTAVQKWGAGREGGVIVVVRKR